MVDWSDPSNMPFLNPYNFLVKNKEIKPIVSDSDVTIEWSFGDEEVRIQVFIRGELFAVLEKGSLPGWSTLVIKDGPLAKKR